VFIGFKNVQYTTDLLIPSVISLLVTILFMFPDQIGWAAYVSCPNSPNLCNGTPGDDFIVGAGFERNYIRGLAGNDVIIVGCYTCEFNNIFGDDGDDLLLGARGIDVLSGGRGNDKYDGFLGDDIIFEDSAYSYLEQGVGTLVNNSDIIKGGEGDDSITSGEGVDRIEAGPGNDVILPNGYRSDFSYDIVNCGSGTGDRVIASYSGDPDIANNCEFVEDFDR
jgi:Ca2+-binding RTX toxin-like protein